MSFFANIGRSVLGASGYGGSTASSASEDVERLCDRLASSSLLDDRREAVRALKEVAKTDPSAVCGYAVGPLLTALRRELGDPELCCLVLDTLLSVADPSDSEKNDDALAIALRFAEIVAKRQDNVALLMEVLEEYAFQVRWSAVKLVTALIHAKAPRMQECILACPMGVSRLMDLLSDSREVIRNDGLLLLKELTSKSDQIQGIVAFESGYDKVLDIIADEGYSDGGVVAEDCLDLLDHLLCSNSRNQSLFLEGSHLPKLVPFFDLEKPEDGTWPQQKVNNLLSMLKILRSMVVPGSSALASAQKAFLSSRVLSALCSLVFTRGLQSDVLAVAINTVAECIRGSPPNQSAFAAVQVGTNPPRSAVLAVITSLVSEKQVLALRVAALYCLEAFLLDNHASQKHLVATMLPGSSQAGVSAGALLCGGLMSSNPVLVWCASSALCSIVVQPEQKEQLLGVHIGMVDGGAPVSLLQQTAVLACSHQLSLVHRVACFSLLCTWLHSCPQGIALLVRSGSALQVLVSGLDQRDAANDDEVLRDKNRILRGMMAFLLGICILHEKMVTPEESIRHAVLQRHNAGYVVETLSSLPESELFLRAGKSPQLTHKAASDVLFTHGLVLLYRQTVDDITSKIRGESSLQASQDYRRGSASPVLASAAPIGGESQVDEASMQREHEAVILSYKELIRQQDVQLLGLKQHAESIAQERDRLRQERDAFASQLERKNLDMQHRSQPVETATQLLHSSTELASELQEMRHTVAMLQESNTELKRRLAVQGDEVDTLRQQLAAASAAGASGITAPEAAPHPAAASVGSSNGNSQGSRSVAALDEVTPKGHVQEHVPLLTHTSASVVMDGVQTSSSAPVVSHSGVPGKPEQQQQQQQQQQAIPFCPSIFEAPSSNVSPAQQTAHSCFQQPAHPGQPQPAHPGQPQPVHMNVGQPHMYTQTSTTATSHLQHSNAYTSGVAAASFGSLDQFSSLPLGYSAGVPPGNIPQQDLGEMNRVANLRLDSTLEP